MVCAPIALLGIVLGIGLSVRHPSAPSVAANQPRGTSAQHAGLRPADSPNSAAQTDIPESPVDRIVKMHEVIDRSPISLVHLALSLAGPPYAPPPQAGTIYPLRLMRIVQKVPDGYFMQEFAGDGNVLSYEYAFLKTNAQYEENAVFIDPPQFAICTGAYDYQAMNGFSRHIPAFTPLPPEGNDYVILRLQRRAPAQ